MVNFIRVNDYVVYKALRPSLKCNASYRILGIKSAEWASSKWDVLTTDGLRDFPGAVFFVKNDNGNNRWYPAQEFDLSRLDVDAAEQTDKKEKSVDSKWEEAFLDVYDEYYDADYCSDEQQVLVELAHKAGYEIETERTFKLVKRV